MDRFFETALELLCIASPDGRFERVNRQWENVLGWKVAELEGRPLLEFVHPDDVDASRAVTASLAGGGEVVDFVNRFRCADGSYRSLEWRSRLDDGKIIAAARDISARLSAEEALRDGEQRFSRLFQGMGEVGAYHKLVYDADGKPVDYMILDVNPAFSASTGIPRDAAVGRLASELYGTGEPPYFEAFSRVATSGESERFETHFEPMGKYFRITVSSPTPGHFFTITEDITEAKKAELERERLLAELKARNAEMERYLYVASHDLRSPLVNIQGFGAQLEKAAAKLAALAAEAGGEGPWRDRAIELLELRIPRALGFIRSSTERMDRLINGILSISRTGRAPYAPRRLDMRAMVEAVTAAFKHQLESVGAVVDIGELPPCIGDQDLIAAALSNIIDNAIKYRSPERPLRLTVRALDEGRWIRYELADNGRGFPAGHEEKLFELFYRAEPAGGVEGEGLGLAHVRKIAERHGGAVGAARSPAGGALFWLRLPAASEGKR
jgi:PAS domain S-box-containing protein